MEKMITSTENGETLTHGPDAGGNSIAHRIEWARTRKGMSKTELAHRSGVAPHQVSTWTRLKRPAVIPERTSIAKLARALEVYAGWLQDGRGWFELPPERHPEAHPKPEAMEDRVAVLEHALHETRQRCDLLKSAVCDLAMLVAPDILGELTHGHHASTREVIAAIAGRGRLTLATALEAETGLLEPTHHEGMPPEWDLADGAPSHDEALLNGAIGRYLRREAIRDAELGAAA